MCIFFFNDTATTEIYTLSLHDALPICRLNPFLDVYVAPRPEGVVAAVPAEDGHVPPDKCLQCLREVRLRGRPRSEEHTSELQSRQYLVCRLLLEKKKIQHESVFSSRPL